MTEWFEPRGSVWRRWILACVAGLVLHVGALFAALYQPVVEFKDDDISGPIAIELAPLPVSPQTEMIDAPLGPRVDEVQAAPETPDKTEVAKAEDAPNLPTTPYDPDDPELRMSKLTLKKDETDVPKEDTTTDKVEQPPVPAATAVPETTAPPPTDAAPAATSAAPQAGLSKADTEAIERWQRKIVVHLNKFKRYPTDARSARIEGDVMVSFTVDRFGRIVTRNVVTPSGAASLDGAALETLARAGILPPPPTAIAGNTIELSLPIQYRFKN